MPNLDTPQGAAQYASEWDSYVGDIQDALQQSSGLERERLAAQMQDAAAGRANAYKIASLQAKTQRYGIDKNFESQMNQLKENARQFDSNHALEMEKFGFEKEKFGKVFGLQERQFGLDTQKFGLDYAKTATDYLSTPDRYAQGMDFRMMADRYAANPGQGPQPYGTGVDFQPKTPQDFAALASFGQQANTPTAGQPAPPAAPGQPSPPTAPAPATPPTAPAPPAPAPGAGWSPPRLGDQSLVSPGQGNPSNGYMIPGPDGTWQSNPAAATGTGSDPTGTGQPAPDPRVKVIKSMFDAMPPSTTPGYDENDLAVMRAAHALMGTNLLPGTLQRMRPDQKKIYGSFVTKSGRSWQDYQDDVAGYAPNQRSVRSA